MVVGNLHKLEWVDADGCPLKRYRYTQKKSESKEHVGIQDDHCTMTSVMRY
jgi:hypothetical protein